MSNMFIEVSPPTTNDGEVVTFLVTLSKPVYPHNPIVNREAVDAVITEITKIIEDHYHDALS